MEGQFFGRAADSKSTAAAAAAAANNNIPARVPPPQPLGDPMFLPTENLGALASYVSPPEQGEERQKKGGHRTPQGRGKAARPPVPPFAPPAPEVAMDPQVQAQAAAAAAYGGYGMPPAFGIPFPGAVPPAPPLGQYPMGPMAGMMQPYAGYYPYPGMPMMNWAGMGQHPMPAPGVGGGAKPRGGKADQGGKNNAGKEKRGRKAKGGKSKPAERPPSPTQDDDADGRSDELQEVKDSQRHSRKSTITLEKLTSDLIIEFAKDKDGSKFLQTELDQKAKAAELAMKKVEATGQKQAEVEALVAAERAKDWVTSGVQQPELAELFAAEREKAIAAAKVKDAVCTDACNLANDVYGNFVVQKLFDVCDAGQKKVLADALQPAIVKLSCETYGCRVIQKAIGSLSKESQIKLAGALKDEVQKCIEDLHGNHVIQKCIEQMPPDSVTFIIQEVEKDTNKMASHAYGCRVIQRLLEHCASSQLDTMLSQILKIIPRLSQDSFGNYVVQHMLEHGRWQDKKQIIEIIEKDIVNFAKHKCSSNVVEKCFEFASVGEHAPQLEKERTALYRTVLGQPGSPNSPLQQLVDDRFGNYIVQRMMEHSRGNDRTMLQERLSALEPHLRNSINGKHILTALQKEFGAVS